MSNIDERVVAMKFQEGGFANGIKGVLDSLSSLKAGLKLDGATKGLTDLDAAGKKIDLSSIGNGAEGISGKFIAMATVAITALSTITSKIISTGTQMIKSFSVDPIKDGLAEYETNLNSIQTILSNTSTKGTTLDQVNGALQELNTYSDKTIYNFAEMARNVGTFTAAGVDLDTSVAAIKGIANLAAVSGSSSAQAASGMYQLSQAISSGTVKLMDWNSVQASGMGGEVFQESLKETARVHGVEVDKLIEKNGSFRDSLTEGWLSAEILTETLSKFTGDLTGAQLESMGYTDDQIVGILKMGETAVGAAQDVKTFTQLLGTLKEGSGSGWAQSWQIMFGDFKEAKATWTGVSNVLGGMITASAAARNKVLQDWKDAGGRDAAIGAIKNAFTGLLSIMAPIKEAFGEIFPPATGAQLADITKAIRDFAAKLTLSSDTAAKVKSIFKGLFALIDIGKTLIMGFAGAFIQMFQGFAKGNGDILGFLASIGDFIVGLRDSMNAGTGLITFFGGLNKVLAVPVMLVNNLKSAIMGLFSKETSDPAPMGSALDRIQKRLEPLGVLGDGLATLWSHLGDIFSKVWSFFVPLAKAMGDFFGGFGTALGDSMASMDFGAVLDTINTLLFGGLVLLIKKFLKDGVSLDVSGGFLGKFKGILDGVTGSLSAMQTNLKADTLLKIATALGILTLSVVALSLIDSGKLTTALAALTVMFVQLGGAMAVFEKIGTAGSSIKLVAMAAGLTILSVAILILTASVTVLSRLSWQELAKGLTGVVVLLAAVAGAVKLMGSPGNLIAAGLGMMAIAVAIKILASAIGDFAKMSWEELAKGVATVTVLLAALSGAAILMSMNAGGLIAGGIGMVAVAIAIKILAGTMKEIAKMSWEDLGKSLAAMAVALGIIVGAMYLMEFAIPGAVALLVVAASLVILTGVLQTMAGMSYEEIAKSLVVLAGSLIIIAGAMALMEFAIFGAAALLIVAASLAILAPILLLFGGMSWEEIGKGMVMLAGVFLIFGLAGLALTPVIPTLIGLGIAVALIGVGVLLAGIGVLAFSVALTALSVAVGVAGVAIVALVASLIGLIPMAMTALGEGLIAFALVISTSGPTIVLAMVTLMTSLLTAITTVAPMIIDTLLNLVLMLLEALVVAVPKFVDAGMRLIIGFLNGIAGRIGEVIRAGTNLIVSFLNGLAASIPRIAASATNLITTFISEIGKSAGKIAESAITTVITFVNSVANSVRTHSAEMNAAGRNLAGAIIDGMINGITGGISSVVSAAKNMAKNALNAAKNLLGIKSPSREFFKVGDYSTQGLANGLKETSGVVVKAAEGVGSTAIAALKNTMAQVGDAVSGNIDFAPNIRPVIDLTNIRKGAEEMAGLLTPNNVVVPSASYNKAATISNSNRVASESAAQSTMLMAPEAPTAVTYNQYNSSPKELSKAEIYRQTKNQLSVSIGGLPG